MTSAGHACPPTDLSLPSPEEHDARVLVARHTNARLVQTDRSGGPDFCIEREGSHHGILEVTRETNQDWRAQEAQLKTKGWVFYTSLIDLSWQLDLIEGVVPMKLDLDAIAELTAAIDALGLELFPDSLDEERPEVSALRDHGVASGYRRDEPGGYIYFGTPGIQTWTGADHLNEAVTHHVGENRAKITSGPGERHLFLWIEFHSTPTWIQVTDGPLPDSAPPLDDVDVVWVAAEDREGVHLWRADASGWAVVQ
ncbi:MAG: hypothetical protein P1T08_15480 [Acidimicrobiia bacterium]|nr:hypothetical protein [Acidimicrobiia bacterium]